MIRWASRGVVATVGQVGVLSPDLVESNVIGWTFTFQSYDNVAVLESHQPESVIDAVKPIIVVNGDRKALRTQIVR